MGTILIPATREVHWMNGRLLCPVMSGVVIVQGQPPGCTIYEFPNTTFRKGVSFKELGLSADSPDAVLLGMLGCTKFPPADPGPSP